MQAAVIQLAGWTPAEMVFVDRLALQINIPTGAGLLDVASLLREDDPDDDTPSAELPHPFLHWANANLPKKL